MHAPVTSVVVAAWGSAALLKQCLASLAASCAADAHPTTGAQSVEIIVATTLRVAELGSITSDYPLIRCISVPSADVFTLRARGAAMARGKLIAIIEDHVVVSASWMHALCSAWERGQVVMGGPVENGTTRSTADWALYFVEYGVHMPSATDDSPRDVSAVSGVNVAYDAQRLRSVETTWHSSFHENEVNDVLAALGHRPHWVPQAIVHTHLPMTFGQGVRHLFSGGRQYASYRSGHLGIVTRMGRVLAFPLVPLVMFRRLARRVSTVQPSRSVSLWRSAVPTLVLMAAWAAGECTGYAAPPSAEAGAVASA